MEEKKYLTGKSYLGYFLSSFGNNFGYYLVTTAAMLFMTDYMGMNAGIVGILIAFSKVFDGVTDVICGTIIQNTKSKLGRARAWMLRMLLPMAVLQVLCFCIGKNWSDFAVYAYFFVTYLVFNAVLNTLYGIAYNTMPVFITRNKGEQAKLSICNFGGGTVASTVIASVYLVLIGSFGGDAAAWRTLAIIFGVIFVILEGIAILCMKELPPIETEKMKESEGRPLKQVVDNFKYLLSNRFFIYQLLIMIIYTASSSFFSVALPYYAIYILQDETVQGLISISALGIIIGLFCSPALIKKMGIYKVNVASRIIGCFFGAGVIVGAFMRSVPVIMLCNALFYICSGPYLGAVNPIIAEISAYSLRKDGVSIDASVFSCNTMGTKVGQALGAALVGWLLAAANYDGTLAVQPASAETMIILLFAAAPAICNVIVTVLMALLNPEKANKKWDEENPEAAAKIRAMIEAADQAAQK